MSDYYKNMTVKNFILLCALVAATVPVIIAEICKDHHERCEYWSDTKGYCDGAFKWWMVKNCKESCGLCHEECAPEKTIEDFSYSISKTKMSYKAAHAHCMSRGGMLAHTDLKSMEVRKMLSEKLNFRNDQSFWIGLDKLENGVEWKWADGTVAERKTALWAVFAPQSRTANQCAYIYSHDKLAHKDLRSDNWYDCKSASSYALCQFNCDRTCSLEFTAASKWSSISSPKDPNLFYYFPNCEWTIDTAAFTNIALEVIDFPSLPDDNVAIFDGAELVAELNGEPEANQRFIVGPHAFLQFSSPHWHAREFTIRYKGFDQCEINPCLNSGICAQGDLYGDSNAEFTCQCQKGYIGARCEIAVPDL